VKAFVERPLEGDWRYLWLDATYLKVREGRRIVSVAAIIAVAANTEGRREIVGLGGGVYMPKDLSSTSSSARSSKRLKRVLRRSV
jgi:Transposase, Mutator family